MAASNDKVNNALVQQFALWGQQVQSSPAFLKNTIDQENIRGLVTACSHKNESGRTVYNLSFINNPDAIHGQSPLNYALSKKKFTAAENLIQFGADLTKPDKNRVTAKQLLLQCAQESSVSTENITIENKEDAINLIQDLLYVRNGYYF